jgi:hypothetical protein
MGVSRDPVSHPSAGVSGGHCDARERTAAPNSLAQTTSQVHVLHSTSTSILRPALRPRLHTCKLENDDGCVPVNTCPTVGMKPSLPASRARLDQLSIPKSFSANVSIERPPGAGVAITSRASVAGASRNGFGKLQDWVRLPHAQRTPCDHRVYQSSGTRVYQYVPQAALCLPPKQRLIVAVRNQQTPCTSQLCCCTNRVLH